MTPRQKTALLLGVVSTGGLLLCSLCPPLLFAAVLVAGGLSVFLSQSGELLSARPGLGPQTGPNGTGALRQLWGWWVTDVSGTRGRTKRSGNRCVPREAEGRWRQRPGETALYRREVVAGESFQFSPRDYLMGSYIGKHDSPVGDCGMPRIERNPREQLRERLSRPNHAVLTPNRRLSFAGEPVEAVSRFMITPQRHYPLQQPGVPLVGVLPSVSWEGFRKKNVLTPRNSPAALSPVTVKIAKPEHKTPSLESLNPAGLNNGPADPCSRESVLKVLRESRKREVDDDDRSFITEQKSKRRRNDSGGSCHSAFESLLPNGVLSQLIPMPGSLKRGMTSVVEESTMKRSRTSSISSGSGVPTPRGTPGTKRNPISSSHSSSLGLPQWKKPSAPTSPASSSGSSRSHSPEGLSKRPRQEDGPSPSSTSSVMSDRTASDQATVSSSRTLALKVPVSADPAGSGRRKRRIQLVSSNRDDRISLPPPPELGYTITVKDLDEEKKAAIGKIQKVLETPAVEPEKPISAPPTLNSLLAAPLPVVCGSVTPVINLDAPPSSTTASNLLLDALKKKSISPLSSTSAVGSTSVSVSSSPLPASSHLKPLVDSPQASQSTAAPSAFTQVSRPSSGTSSAATEGALAASSPAPVCSASQQVPAAPAASTAPLLVSGFKPIFSVSTTSSVAVSSAESNASVQSFKPVFGGTPSAAVFRPAPSLTTATSAPVMSVSTSSVFGASMSSTTVTLSAFPSLTPPPTVTAPTGSAPKADPPAVKSLFGSWSTPSSSMSAVAPAVGSSFQFGAVATTTGGAAASSTSSNGVFSFGGTQASCQAAGQKPFGFSQMAPGQNVTTGSFGSFVAAANTSTTTTTQSTFTFGKPSFEVPAAQLTFSSTSAPVKPFTFGGVSASLAPNSNPAPVPFAFGAAAATSAPSFSTPAKPVFGTGATGFPFSGTTVASAAPTFGATTQTQSSSSGAFTFGGATSLPAPTGPVQPASSGFSFGAGMSCPQFGTPAASNTAPQMGGFSFGAGARDKPAFGTSTPAFGQSATAAPIPFGGSATPVQSFNAPPFGSPATPSFSIGAGSKPLGARQRLQARRQHNRKK